MTKASILADWLLADIIFFGGPRFLHPLLCKILDSFCEYDWQMTAENEGFRQYFRNQTDEELVASLYVDFVRACEQTLTEEEQATLLAIVQTGLYSEGAMPHDA